MHKLFTLVLILLLPGLGASAQIVINGHNPARNSYSGPLNGLSISIAQVVWADGGYKPLQGYSQTSGLASSYTGALNTVERYNASVGAKIGYDRQLTSRLSIVTTLFSSKMISGTQTRPDLVILEDKSRMSQLGVYGSWRLTRDENRRLQFGWMLGPEAIYATRNVLIEKYTTEGSETAPDNYRQKITVAEGAIVTGPGGSLRIANAFELFGNTMFGITIPGGALKGSSTGLGLKYRW
jgi:hypothetical protein